MHCAIIFKLESQPSESKYLLQTTLVRIKIPFYLILAIYQGRIMQFAHIQFCNEIAITLLQPRLYLILALFVALEELKDRLMQSGLKILKIHPQPICQLQNCVEANKDLSRRYSNPNIDSPFLKTLTNFWRSTNLHKILAWKLGLALQNEGVGNQCGYVRPSLKYHKEQNEPN